MKRITSILQIEEDYGLIIGNFDGFHKGHQTLLKNFLRKCKELALRSVVVTFDPHPMKIFHPNSFGLISTSKQKEKFMQEIKDDFKDSSVCVDYYYPCTFNRDMSLLEPEQFIESYLLGARGSLKLFYIGYDFCFGKNKKGNFDFLQSYFEGKNVVLVRNSPVHVTIEGHEVIVSSTLIRESIRNCLFSKVKKFLGQHFFISGRVIEGEGRGKSIGIPTANLLILKDQLLPPNGVYATLTIFKGMNFYSVTNIGYKPTFHKETFLSIENHILDFQQDIYGQEVCVSFVQFLRSERKFHSVNDLHTQIQLDIENSRSILKNEV